MNKITLIGNLVRDPESGSTNGGVNFTRFTIAVNRPFTTSDGERVADYFDVIAWRGLAERCAKYLFKGSKVGVHGYVQRRQYEDRDGIKRTSFDVVADEVEFLSQRPTAENSPSNQRSDRNTSRGNSQANGVSSQTARNPSLLDDLTPVSQQEADDLPF